MKLINLFVSLLRGPSTHLSEKINTMSLQFDVSKYIIAQIYHCCCLSADLRALFLFFLIKFAPATQRTKTFAHPFFIQVIGSNQELLCLYIYLVCLQVTSDLRKHNSVGERNVPVTGPLVGGRAVLYSDWHYLHLLLCSKGQGH